MLENVCANQGRNEGGGKGGTIPDTELRRIIAGAPKSQKS